MVTPAGALSPSASGAGVPPLIPPIHPDDDHVRTVRDKVAPKLVKMGRDDRALRERDPDLFSIGFGLISGSSATPRGASYFSRLVRADDWAAAGYLTSRARRRPGEPRGYMRAEFIGGGLFEAYGPGGEPDVTGLYRDGRPIGAWRAVDYTYDGRFRQPLCRELWSTERRLGLLDTALMSSGAAVLEIDPDGHPLIPLRVRRSQVIAGNPLAEIWKATPFGKRLGPRSPNLDLVLAPQAAWLADPADQALVFAASLALRALLCQRAESSD